MKLLNKIKPFRELFVIEYNIKKVWWHFLGKSEFKKSILHYKNDIIVLKDRLLKIEGLKKYIVLKIKNLGQNNKKMKYNRVRCDIWKIDIHRTSYSKHLKTKKHLEIISQIRVFIPRKNPKKRVVKEDIKVSDTEDANLYYFTDRILKIAYDINIDIHHDKHAISTIISTSKFNDIGFDIVHIFKILEELAEIFAKLIGQFKFKYQLTFLAIINKNGEKVWWTIFENIRVEKFNTSI